ncbi:MAG: protocatechuate 3,4-dioxygenase subunit beta [Alphaproteobacteria bacterium]|nr:protocatechuate 3,4-dioxygenase subunit beta [Alphaproteobacteria bacterium]
MSLRDPVPYARDSAGAQPPNDFPDYKSTIKRAPKQAPVRLQHTLTETTGPVFKRSWVGKSVADLTRQHKGEPLGERIIVAGRVLDEDGRPVPGTLVEMWQANAAGRYAHPRDRHDAPLDRNFTGVGQVITDKDGNWRFITIKPGHYPWRNTYNAWRAQHLHFSVFGPAFATRVVTQMYFPGDPLLADDPIYNAIPDRQARERLVSVYDPNLSEAEWALGFRWNMVLRGREATPTE